MKTKRRGFLKRASVGAIGIAATSIPNIVNASAPIVGATKLGIASYSLRKFSLEESLDMTIRCGLNRINLKSMHLPMDSDKQTIRKAVLLCKQKGVVLYGGGVIYMKTKEAVDQAFEYAKTAEMKMIIGVPNHELLKYVEEKVKEYDIKLAIHNHGPGDKLYPSAESAYVKIKHMDKRMGLCIDIGHTKRIGRNPEQDVKDFFDRVFDVHLKDVTKGVAEGKPCVVGRGVIDFQAFLQAISKLGYEGTLALEYEIDENDPLPEMAESIGYVKGIIATL